MKGHMDIKDIEKIMKMMVKYQMASFEMDGLTLSKNVHTPKQPKATKPAYKPPPFIDVSSAEDEVLFHSSSAPKFSLSDFDKYAAKPILAKS